MTNTPYQIQYDPLGAIGLGFIKRARNFNTFGIVLNLASDTNTDMTRLHELLGVTDVPLPNNSGESLEIISNDPTDSASMTILSLGANGVAQSPVTVALNGTSPVAIPGNISRIQSVFTDDDAGYAGPLFIQQAGGGIVFAGLIEEDQLLQQGRYTFPINTRGYIGNLIGTMQKTGGGNSDVVISVLFKKFTQNRWRRPFVFGLQRDGDTSIEFANKFPTGVTGPFDIKVQCVASAAGAGAAAFFSGPTFDN